jgi:PAS domain S-box-containing protein
MFAQIQKKIFYWLNFPTSTSEKNRDIIDFRGGLLVGTFIMLLIPLLNTVLNDGILDHSLIRNILIISQVILFIASYRVQGIIKYCNEIIYILTILYILMVQYALFLKGFTIRDTASASTAIFCMGGIFKNKNYLIAYYSLISCSFVIFMISCPKTEIDKLYTTSMIFINLLLGIYIFGSKINAMKEASESKEWFRNLFNNSPVSIALVGSNIKVFKINEHFQTILGYSENEIMLNGLDPIIHPDDRIADNVLYDALFATPNGSYKTEMRLQNKKGDTVWMRVSISKSHFESSIIPESKQFVIAVFDDITEKKRADLLLSENATQLLQQNRALEEFSYVISHDLQEPLRMITSFSQIIQRRYLSKLNNPDIDRDFNFVIDGAKRMSKLIKDMLEYSRWTSQQFPIEKVDTQDVIAEVLQNLTISIGQANAEITVGELPTLMANRLVISQVFQNLIGNSINYRHPDRQPTIRVDFKYQTETKRWLCSVRDNGRGFDEKQKERIFGIFQRLHTDKKGTGMGLAICKRIIEKQGGKIWAEGVPDEGATFLFTV